jgi:transposase
MTSSPPPTAATPDSTAIPVQLSAQEFATFILPQLSVPKRGPRCKIGYHKAFHYILKVLYTGMQWKELPLDKGPEGKAALHYTGVFQLFARWAEDGSLERAFLASVKQLDEAKNLDLSLLHGDGSNTVAKKGATRLATVATSTRRARKCSRLSTITATSCRR